MERKSMTNSDSFKKYHDALKGRATNVILIPDKLPIETHISILLSGPDLTEQTASSPKKLEVALAANDKNPYVRARAEVLKKMKSSDRALIEKMEETKNTNNYFYEKFVKAVAAEGDKLSS